ncbi:apolipoprotein N-acyltransferase [Vibrio cincinnatiensis]|uniref:apolipoprotein N-acyltransferase n=1 Tax=Vibrio cincinnatiensis TaxID=675 RepID=UPI001EDF6B4F|nr:apolipoprotein N-acyltransferase [Vibrio cincinnatiensis]MCG3722484.1 apolipoprotein N-acyltransferase [Vibrio cincinnatiensis]MCG3726463.1 apolipoprotein N-acyltransferase [Vibrio cincinnatiensis]
MKNYIHRLIRPFLALCVGAITPLAFAPYQLWPLAILSPCLLLLLIHHRSAKQAAFIGYCWGLGQFGFGISWVHVSIDTFGGLPKIASFSLMLLLVGYLSFYSGLFAWALNRFFPRAHWSRFLLASPVLWLTFDWLRGWVMTGFPWLWLGYSQIDSPLASFAPLGGVELITLVVLMCASSFSYVCLTHAWRFLLIPIALFSISFAFKAQTWVTPEPERTTTLAIIQGNIQQSLKWHPNQRWPTIMKYTDLSRENWDADIIIWPEAAIPAFELELGPYLSNLDSAARMNKSAVITGILNYNEQGQYFNSVLALGNTPYGDYRYDVEHRYHKHHLLPFGEFVPLEKWLRPLAPLFNLPMSSFSRGEYVQPNIFAANYAFAPALCYEIIFNEQLRTNVTEQTDFLLTLSNDAWFGRSNGPLQHMEIARMRALELGKPLVRSTNNGVTAITDQYGKITHQLPQFETGVLRAEITPTRGQTPYYRWGSWPLYIWCSLSLAISFLVTRRH